MRLCVIVCWVEANNGCSVTHWTLHKKQKCRECECVWSASVNTVATLYIHTPEPFTGDVYVRDNIVIAQIGLYLSVGVGSSAQWLVFQHPRVSNYQRCADASHELLWHLCKARQSIVRGDRGGSNFFSKDTLMSDIDGIIYNSSVAFFMTQPSVLPQECTVHAVLPLCAGNTNMPYAFQQYSLNDSLITANALIAYSEGLLLRLQKNKQLCKLLGEVIW